MSFFRRGFRSFGYRPRFGYRRGYNRYWRRRGWYRRGASRSQAAGNRRFKLVVPLNMLYGVQVAAGQTLSPVYAISPFCSNVANNLPQHCIGNLFSNASFIRYCTLYDEVKVDWVAVTLECMENIGANVNSVAVYTAIDRRCSYAELNSVAGAGSPWPAAGDLMSSSSATTTFMNSTARKSVRRFFAATDLIEKNQFIDTDYTLNNGVYMNDAFFAAAGNPNFFCPAVQFAILLPGAAPAGGYSVPFCFNVKWGVTFRGPKFSSQASATKSVELDVKDEVSVSPVKVSGAGKTESSKSSLTGLAKEVLGRLALFVSDVPNEYETGENDWQEDLEFLIDKVGVDKVREYFPEGSCVLYDKYLKDKGLISDDPTELVKDSKS